MINDPNTATKSLSQDKAEEVTTRRTPGRKLVKEDLASTSVLIRGCTVQTCCRVCPTAMTDHK
jgi:hypothetical protein